MTAPDPPQAAAQPTLAELSKAATPGPWAAEPDTMAGRVWVALTRSRSGDLEPVTLPPYGIAVRRGDIAKDRLFEVRHEQKYNETREANYAQREADAAYIAALANSHRDGSLVSLDWLREVLADPEVVETAARGINAADDEALVDSNFGVLSATYDDEARAALAAVLAAVEQRAGGAS